MKTVDHPAFIENYNKSYTELLKTMPIGTYALMQPHEHNPETFLIVFTAENKVPGLQYTEWGSEYLSTSYSNTGVGVFETTIDKIVGNGIDQHKTINYGSNRKPIQLTDTLNNLLKIHPELKSKLKTDEQLEEAKNLSKRQQATTQALAAEIKSSKFRCESNEVMRVAIKLIEEKGKNHQYYAQIIRGLYRVLYLTQKDIWLKGYSYSAIKEGIEKLGSKPVKDHERLIKLPYLFAVTEAYKLPFDSSVDMSAKEMARSAFGCGSNTAKQYAASFFAGSSEKVKDQAPAPALSLRKSFNK